MDCGKHGTGYFQGQPRPFFYVIYQLNSRLGLARARILCYLGGIVGFTVLASCKGTASRLTTNTKEGCGMKKIVVIVTALAFIAIWASFAQAGMYIP
ncbi:MAG: hypothetical protein SVS15_05825 [Thermodesulfobacteriota bacterium]|nr:hypothetical protein [Thermodesulfobacteriota bacterium]